MWRQAHAFDFRSDMAACAEAGVYDVKLSQFFQGCLILIQKAALAADAIFPLKAKPAEIFDQA